MCHNIKKQAVDCQLAHGTGHPVKVAGVCGTPDQTWVRGHGLGLLPSPHLCRLLLSLSLCTVCTWWLVYFDFYTALFSALEQTRCACMWFYEWLAFYSAFLNMHRSGVPTGAGMAGATWNCCCLSASSVYTIQPCTVSLHAKPHV